MEWHDIFNFGVPTALLLIIVIGFWKALSWMAGKLDPVVKAHLELIETLKDHVPKQTDAISAQTDEMSKMSSEISNQTKSIDKQTEMLEKRTDLFDQIKDNQHKIIDELAKVPKGNKGKQ